MLNGLKQFSKFYKFSTAPAKSPRVAVFSAKKYDVKFFNQINQKLPIEKRIIFDYFEEELNEKTAILTQGYDVICPFVNDKLNSPTIQTLAKNGIDLIALRCAGFNNTDLECAYQNNIKVVRVPAYSPHAVAEHTMALLLSIVRKIHKAHNRTKDGNFSLDGLLGFDLYKKKIGIFGTGKIGITFMGICQGFGMEILCNDPFPNEEAVKKYNAKYVDQATLFKESDIISLHCPLTFSTQYIIDRKTIDIMKRGAIILNTGRGKLMRTDEVIAALKTGQLGGLALDVYEHEEGYFFKDVSSDVMYDDDLARLLMYPNVIVTSHQAFFTQEAITAICQITIDNILKIKGNEPCDNMVLPLQK
ncbi:hypothetical protein ABPG72_015828 [Tetrahymena utriculariae]